MMPGDMYIYKCPTCGNLLIKESIISGNTFGATFYSDGKMDAPMLPEFPDLIKCPKCNSLMWLSKMEEIGIACYGFFENPEWNTADEVEFLKLEDLFRALNSGLVENKKEERYVRIRIWWAFNDKMRKNKKYQFLEPEEQRYINNIKKLIPLLRSSNNEHAIMLAELHRNLGNFDRCLELLNKVNDEQFNNKKRVIRRNCLIKNKRVVKIDDVYFVD